MIDEGNRKTSEENYAAKFAWLGLGANLGDRAGTIRESLRMIDALPGTSVIVVSSLYRTPPVGPPDQPEYINCAASIQTTYSPFELLAELKEIEQNLGRKERARWRERELDIDILFYGDQIVEERGLKIPHPELHKRSFVLVPLAEIAPNLHHPILNKNVHELLKSVGRRGVVQWE